MVDFNPQSEGFKLFSALRQFTQLAFSHVLSEADLNDMGNLSRTIVNSTKQLDTVHTFKVTPKLHNLLHYVDHVKLFGPLALRSTLAMERKHKSSTDWASVMVCFKNPSFSFLDRHQSMLVIKTANYKSLDFFSVDTSEPVLLSEKPELAQKIKLTSPVIPHRLQKGVLRQFRINGEDYWVNSSGFWADGKEIICEGMIYISSFVHSHPFCTTVEKFSPVPMFINLKYLSHVNHFLSTVNADTVMITGLL